MDRSFSILPYVAESHSVPASKIFPPFANNVSCRSFDTRQPAFDVDYFAAELCARLEIIRKQDEKGQARALPGCEARNKMFASSPITQSKPFTCDLFTRIPDERSDNEAMLWMGENGIDLNIAPIESEANETQRQTLEESSNLSRVFKGIPLAIVGWTKTLPPPRLLEIVESAVEADVLSIGALVMNTEIRLTKDVHQPTRKEGQPERTPVEIDLENSSRQKPVK